MEQSDGLGMTMNPAPSYQSTLNAKSHYHHVFCKHSLRQKLKQKELYVV